MDLNDNFMEPVLTELRDCGYTSGQVDFQWHPMINETNNTSSIHTMQGDLQLRKFFFRKKGEITHTWMWYKSSKYVAIEKYGCQGSFYAHVNLRPGNDVSPLVQEGEFSSWEVTNSLEFGSGRLNFSLTLSFLSSGYRALWAVISLMKNMSTVFKAKLSRFFMLELGGSVQSVGLVHAATNVFLKGREAKLLIPG